MQQGKPADMSDDAVRAIAQGGDLDFRTGGSREVSALLNVMRNNRASDRALAAAEGAPEHVVDFVSKMSRAANLASQQSGVPARLIMGQAALESGWGQREIKHPDGSTSYNLFGIKATGWQGESASATTTEYVNGKATREVAGFRAYDSFEQSFNDFVSLLENNDRYRTAIQVASNSGDSERFVKELQKAGYATDPQYARKISQIARKMQTYQTVADAGSAPAMRTRG
ncbi:Peptidoglycan hydrolase FlgJ [compost metagenome]